MKKTGGNMKLRKAIKVSFVAVTLSVAIFSEADSLSVPNSFSSGSSTSAAEMNANFSATAAAVNDNDSRISALEASSAPVIQGFSTSTVDGAAGLIAMIAACDATFTGSKICTTAEFANSVHNASASGLSGRAWILSDIFLGNNGNNAIPGDRTSGRTVVGKEKPAEHFTCNGWGGSENTMTGMTVSNLGAMGPYACNNSLSVSCCK
jgi:hypothetical protein